ncbi:unnamed protein product [Lactuca saligna]|uniref:Uncharacterized protein n=1 Tax=Lactuca saligna TaxID=75948 RepID=A0AA36EJ93_LACSI|nr:unnamed protein product [Lactuca saligna]
MLQETTRRVALHETCVFSYLDTPCWSLQHAVSNLQKGVVLVTSLRLSSCSRGGGLSTSSTVGVRVKRLQIYNWAWGFRKLLLGDLPSSSRFFTSSLFFVRLGHRVSVLDSVHRVARFEEMTGAKIVGSVAGAFVLAFACDYIIADKKIFGGTTPSTVSNKEWWEETDKKFQAWPRTAGPPVVMNPISRQNFIVKARD